jgi:hypothetical protein
MRIPRRIRTLAIPIGIFAVVTLTLILKTMDIVSSAQILVGVAQVFISIAMAIISLAGVSSFLSMQSRNITTP